MSNNKVIFVSERTIKDSSIIEENTDSKILRITTLEVQDLELKPIIGRELYKELEDEVIKRAEDNSYEIPEKYISLLEVIKPFIIYGVLTSIAVPLTYKATNKGFAVKNDTNADVADGRDLQFVVNYYGAKFDSYKLRLIEQFQKSCPNGFMTNDLGRSTGMYIQSSGKGRSMINKIVNKY